METLIVAYGIHITALYIVTCEGLRKQLIHRGDESLMLLHAQLYELFIPRVKKVVNI